MVALGTAIFFGAIGLTALWFRLRQVDGKEK